MGRCDAKLLPAIRNSYYPNCIGRAGIWALSPLGLNVVIALFKGNISNKYIDVHNELQTKTVCKLRNAAFYPSSSKHAIFKDFGNVDVKEVDFNKSSAKENIKQWANICTDFKEFDIEKTIPTDTTLALLNYANFKILEIPMEEEHVRLVILVPNEVDLLHTLYRRLIRDGLAASFASFQPIFTIESVFRAPDVAVKSETHVSLKEELLGDFCNESLIQFASVVINENGVHTKVLSCLYSRKSIPTSPVEPNSQPEKLPFFFAITFKDLVLFTGQYFA